MGRRIEVRYLEMLALAVGAILIVVSISWGSFKVYRYVNWRFGYQSKVEQTIKEMVKPECLEVSDGTDQRN